MPSDIPYEVPDQLQAYFDEASELADTDPPACLAIVARMNALMARYRSVGGGGLPFVSGEPGTGEGRNGEVPDMETIPAELRANDVERLRHRIERATDEEAEHLRAVGAYRDAARAYVGAMRSFATVRRSPAADLAQIETAMGEVDELTREFEGIVVLNAPQDVMHARLEDAVRRVEEARRALERAWQRYHARQASEANDHIAPLAGAGFEPAPLVRDFIAPLGDAETRAAQLRLRAAERALKQVRNSWDPYVHRSDRPFLDMRDGYKEAYKGEHARFADELAALDGTLGSYLPDRIGAFNKRRAALADGHEQRLDAIFDRYAIP